MDNRAEAHALRLTDLTMGAADRVAQAGAFIGDLATPTVRLGVTGLSRSGKTVFITALVRNLTCGGRLPFFRAVADGRFIRAYLEPQPDDAVPRFNYEAHLAALVGDPPAWPEGTRRISQLRVTIEYAPEGFLRRVLGPSKLHLDLVDYPGEWLIDLGLIDRSYARWCAEALAQAGASVHGQASAPFAAFLDKIDPGASHEETVATEGARLFTDYLRRRRRLEPELSIAGPGRFLMPGDLEGSPLLTFFPIREAAAAKAPLGSLAATLARRYESYKARVVQPFFRDHFLKLDRQIVLVDALSALNGGAAALDQLESALETALRPFRPGANSWISAFTGRRIDRILFAATKADHLPQGGHDRLEAILGALVRRAAQRAEVAGARTRVQAIAALRATREAEARQGDSRLACVLGTPLAGERVGETTFDGATECAVFPGDLPAQRHLSAADGIKTAVTAVAVRFVRFRPPRLEPAASAPWPHVRLDRALEFLIGDKLS